MRKFQFGLFVAFAVAAVALAGCSEPAKPHTKDASPPATVPETPTKFVIVAKPSAGPAGDHWNKALDAFYSGAEIPGARYLDSSDPEVKAVRALIQSYAKASFDIDYHRVNGREAIPFMTRMAVLILTDNEGAGDQFTEDRDFWVKNRVVQEVTSVTVDGIMFSDDLMSAAVMYRVGETLKSAAPAYLQKQTPVVYSKDHQLKEGGTITRSYVGALDKEDGVWKVGADAEE
mgnify:CR=1 FL=1